MGEGLQVISCQAVAYGNACKTWIQKVSEHDKPDCFDKLQRVVACLELSMIQQQYSVVAIWLVQQGSDWGLG